MEHLNKKIILLSILLLSIFETFAKCQVGELYYNIDPYSKSAVVTFSSLEGDNYKFSSNHIIIPSEITYNEEEYSVNGIGMSAFMGCNDLLYIEIPNTVTYIGSNAFKGCSNLVSSSLPLSIKDIGYGAFMDCSSLMSIEIPNSVSTIASSVFSGCSSLTSVQIPNSVTSIGDSAFFNCSSLTSVHIPNSVTSIGRSAFCNCSSLTSVHIPNSVTSIGRSAFDRCTSLRSVNIPNSITKVDKRVFYQCENLKSIDLSDGINEIGDWTFYSCGSLDSISLPSSITSIGEHAFSHSGIQNIILPKNLKHIGESCFDACSRLNSVVIPSSLDSIPIACFDLCDNLKDVNIKNGVKWIGNFAFNRLITNQNAEIDTYIHIPPSVGTIEERAFSSHHVIAIYNGNIRLNQKSINAGKYVILDTKIPEIEYEGTPYGIFYVPNKESFINKTNYPSSRVYSINEFYDKMTYDGTTVPLRESGPSSSSSVLYPLNLSWFSTAFNETNAGYYNGNSILKIYHDDWESSFPIAYAFKIDPAPLTIKIFDCEKVYGEENPEFDYEINGLCGSDTKETVFQQTPKLSTTCSQKSDAGKYSIVLREGSVNSNYLLSSIEGNLTVKKAILKLAINDAIRSYGQPNPQFDITYDGFKLGDTAEKSFSQCPSVVTDATPKSDAGNYPLSLKGGVAQNYEISECKDGMLTVTKAPLILTAKDAERMYRTENPNFEFSLIGLENDDDNSCISQSPDFACDASITSECGEYEIRPFNAQSKNYEISYQSGNLTINKAPLSISVADASREYGDPNPKFEIIYSGFKEGDDMSSALTKLPTITCSANRTSQVGYYDIEVSGAESDNYDISYTPGVLTVKAAPLTIRPKDVSKIFGSENPEFSVSYLGFKNEDDESCLFRLPKVTTSATAQSSVGTYPIMVSDATAKNYTIEYEEGILTVTKNIIKAQVIDSSRSYGDDNPQFVVKYSGFLNGDNESIITTKPQFTTEANKSSKVGVYSISADGADSPNYDFEYQNGSLTVYPRQINASVGNYVRLYGVSNPKFEIKYSGFVNGDDETSISEPTVAQCDADLLSNAGVYPITLSGGGGENYEVSTFTNGFLSIEKANQTIEWNQDLSIVEQYDQIELEAISSSGLPVTYEVASNNVVDMYTSGGKTYIDCYGTGTVTIRATQSGNENYNAAETITNKVVVVSEGGFLDPTYPEISIIVSTPGTLSSKIAASKKYQIKSLTVSGALNGTDIRYIREMAGRDVDGSSTTGILEKLNLSRATIVSGGDYYYTTSTYASGRKYTSDDNISDYMFYGCSTLTNLTLPQNCTNIGANAFGGCLNLSTLIMSDAIQTIGAYAFSGDISLSRISIPEQTISIGNYAFQNCSGLITLILGPSVTTIGSGILNGCPNIQEITLNSSNAYFSTLNGVLYNNARTSLIIYPAGKQLQTFEIPYGVKEIRNSGFYGVVSLKYLFLPESLTTIGTDAFKGCINLSKLYSRPATPPVCENECFEAVSKSNCTLYVPRWSYNDYWAAPVWGEFLNIKESNDLSVGGNTIKPDYCLEFSETSLYRGKCTYLPISMNNADPVVAFNCDIELPEGLSFYENTSGQIIFRTSDRCPTSQIIDSRIQANGDLRMISTSTSNEAFYGTEGVLFYIPLFITDPNANQDSEYKMIIKNIEFTKKNQSGYMAIDAPDITTTLTVGEYTLGDANGDGRITGIDAVITKGYFLGDIPSNFIFKAADMNFDGKISGTDVVLITDEFLVQNQTLASKLKLTAVNKGIVGISGTSLSRDIVQVDINIPGACMYTAVQMDISAPEGCKISNLRVGDCTNNSHNVQYYQHPNGMIRVFISSDVNSDLMSENVLSFELEKLNRLHNSDEIVIDDVLAVEISGHDYREVSIDGNSVNISNITDIVNHYADNDILIWSENRKLFIKSSKDDVINLYDMIGHCRRVEVTAGINSLSLDCGIYIVNNQKIIIK